MNRLLQPFEVELVGNEWEWVIPLIGPLAIALGALGGAMLTVWFANRRQDKQLKHDRDLHEEQLAHDRELREAQLAHDRSLRANEATRLTIDDVTGVLTNAMDALTQFQGELVMAEEAGREQREAGDQESREGLQRKWNAEVESLTRVIFTTEEAVHQIRPAQLRLRLRFPDSHPVYRNFALCCSAVERTFELLVSVEPYEIRSPEALGEAEEANAEVGRRLNLYVEAVRKWSQSQPSPAEALI
jgi:hypothetical protein